MVTVRAITFLPRVPTCTFSAYSVRAYVFQQLLCKTYALTPYGSKVMIHGVGTPQYQGYGEKILVGSYLKPTAIPSNYVGTFGFGGVLKSKRVFVIVILAPVSIMKLHSSGVKETGQEV